jgi:HK97 family phage major capsid protein
MEVDEIVNSISDLSVKFALLEKKSANMDKIEAALSRHYQEIDEEESDLSKDFDSYIRKGSTDGSEQSSLNSSVAEEGGYLVSKSVFRMVNDHLNNISLIRKLASVEKISTNSLDLIEEVGVNVAGWVLETASRETTASKNFTKKTIHTHEMYAQPKATQRLLDDSSINIEKWIAEKIAESFASLESAAFFKGDGDQMPRGLLTFDENEVQAIKATGSINYDNIVDLLSALPFEYRQNASFVAHPQTICDLMKLKDQDSGRYLWNPSIDAQRPNMLFGIPVFEDRNMPQISEGKIALVLADFKKAYKIVDRNNIQILRDPYTDKPFVKFYATKRVGGDLVSNAAIKYLVC